MEKQSIKEIAENYSERVWNKKDLSALDELLHRDVIIHSLLGDFHGPRSMRKVVDVWLKGFPDLLVKNSAVICEGDIVMIHWSASGTHLGEFKGKESTGKKVSYAGVSIYKAEAGKIAEYWAYLDMFHLLNQLS